MKYNTIQKSFILKWNTILVNSGLYLKEFELEKLKMNHLFFSIINFIFNRLCQFFGMQFYQISLDAVRWNSCHKKMKLMFFFNLVTVFD